MSPENPVPGQRCPRTPLFICRGFFVIYVLAFAHSPPFSFPYLANCDCVSRSPVGQALLQERRRRRRAHQHQLEEGKKKHNPRKNPICFSFRSSTF